MNVVVAEAHSQAVNKTADAFRKQHTCCHHYKACDEPEYVATKQGRPAAEEKRSPRKPLESLFCKAGVFVFEEHGLRVKNFESCPNEEYGDEKSKACHQSSRNLLPVGGLRGVVVVMVVHRQYRQYE